MLEGNFSLIEEAIIYIYLSDKAMFGRGKEMLPPVSQAIDNKSDG